MKQAAAKSFRGRPFFADKVCLLVGLVYYGPPGLFVALGTGFTPRLCEALGIGVTPGNAGRPPPGAALGIGLAPDCLVTEPVGLGE
jgi:hypothetical protein